MFNLTNNVMHENSGRIFRKGKLFKKLQGTAHWGIFENIWLILFLFETYI